jgi:peptide/histidine transporter 3/4
MQAMEAESNKVVPICNTKYRASSTRRPPGLVRAVSLAKDGAVDYRGKPIDKKTTGRLKANAFIIGKLYFFPCCTFLLNIKKIKNRLL